MTTPPPPAPAFGGGGQRAPLDFARHDDAAVQAQLDRMATLRLPQGQLSLGPIRALLGALGNPQDRLPPVFHVAGTNGKGSTCAFLHAMLEAAGCRVHATISPHLVRYNERIRLGGQLIEDAALAALLAEVADAALALDLETGGVSFFEATIAAAFLAFARQPADACVVEVGLGGRFDATNVLARPVACGIATLGMDHERFLLAPEDAVPAGPLARIAFEKAGIAKPGVPLVVQAYPPAAELEVERRALAAHAPLHRRGRDWHADAAGGAIAYEDCFGPLTLPLPALPGAHQADNAALAVAMLRHQDRVTVPAAAMARGIVAARWPARLQALDEGPLAALVPGHALWLDGGHNPDAGAMLARHFAGPLHLIVGMLNAKDPAALIEPLGDRLASVAVLPVPGHASHPPAAFGVRARGFTKVSEALRAVPPDGLPVLIAGSLYLAGDVLRLDGVLPD